MTDTDTRGLELGPFVLEKSLGKGATAEVWQAQHAPSGVPVALKIFTAPVARRPEIGAALENEVRSAAALDHPNIIMLLDQGRVEDPGDSHFATESPYLVMELASGGTLEQAKPLGRYDDLRSILLALLDALAHAHARGVVHRDLTPRNILIARTGDQRPGIKIADFGIALPLERSVEVAKEDALIGTIAYMAPEQLRAKWRDYGPWSDLFSLGLIAQRLASGRSPFVEGLPGEMFEARLLGKRAPLEPLFPLPLGFPSWLDRMVAEEPAHRFPRAADAAIALAELGLAEPLGDLEESETTVRTAIDLSPHGTLHERVDQPLASAHPIPSSWRHPRPARPPIRLVGAGQGLFRVRALPFVGREEERDIIWERLRHAHAHRRAHAVLISGAEGVGKTRLAQWLTERADELSVGPVFRASFAEVPGRTDGLGAMLERHFRTRQLDDVETLAQVKHRLSWFGVLDEIVARALTRMIRPPLAVVEDSIHGPGADRDRRYELVRRFLSSVTRTKTAIVWLDDAHFGADGISLVKHVLDSPEDTGVLFLVGYSRGRLDRRLLESALMSPLLSHDRVTSIELAPLGPEAHDEMVRALLPLSEELAKRLSVQTRGNPQLALELLGNWIDQGVLESDAEGFVVRPGTVSRVPSGVRDVFNSQLEHLLQGRPRDWWRALEAAAVLGIDVALQEWQRAIDIAGIQLKESDLESLLTLLYRASLARPGPRGFTFASAELRQCLLDRAQAAGERKALHAAAAGAIESGAERLAVHLTEAGRGREAATPLLQEARALFEASDLVGARALLDRRDRLLEEEGVLPNDLAWGLGWLLRVEILLAMGDVEDAGKLAARAADVARRLRWRGVLPGATFLSARIANGRADMEEAEALLSRALTAYREEKNVAGEAACMRELGSIHLYAGELDRSERELASARSKFEAEGDRLGLAHTHGCLGLLERSRRDFEASGAHYQAAHDLFAREENTFGEALALNGLGDAHRYQGQLDEAASCYRRAIDLYESVASRVNASTPRLNLALLALQSGDVETAHRFARASLPALEKAGKVFYTAIAQALMLPRHAVEGDRAAWDEGFAKTEELLAISGFFDADVAFTMERAAELARRAEWPEEAKRALTVAAAQHQATGADADAARVNATLRGLD